MRQAGIEPATSSLEGRFEARPQQGKVSNSEGVGPIRHHVESCPDTPDTEADRHQDRPPPHWPVAVYPAAATAFRERNGVRLVYLYGRWRRLSPEPFVCAECGRQFFHAFSKQAGLLCGAACRNAVTTKRNAAAVGAANPAWKGGVSTDNMRYRRRQLERWPEREHARRLTRAEIAAGRLVPLPCEVCGEAKAQAHHDEYSKPLDVRWLCVEHHRAHHGGHATGRVQREAVVPGRAA